MANFADALTLKLQSMICYHRDANLNYLEIKAMVDELVEENKKFGDEKLEYSDMIDTFVEEKENLEHDYQVIKEKVAPMEEQLETVKKELAVAKLELVAEKHEHVAAKEELAAAEHELLAEKHEHVAAKEELAAAEHELVAAKEEFAVAKHDLVAEKHEHVMANEELAAAKHELVAAKHEHVVSREELVVAKEQLAEKNKELEVLKKKLQESEAMHTLQQQKGRAHGPEPVHSTTVTRSIHERETLLPSFPSDAERNCLMKRKSYAQLLNNPIAVQSASQGDGLEVIRQMLIKGFSEIDAGQYLGVKEMGKLNEKPFQDACAMKLPPSEPAARASELYTQWQQLMNNPEWKPFKTVTVDGNHQEEVIDVDDDKLQGLKMALGEGPYNSVIGALVERKERDSKEGRKATIGEFVEHILDQLKEFKQFHATTY